MSSLFLRNDGRTVNQLRPIQIKYDYAGYADANLLFELGQTKVLVSVSLQDGVPQFLRGQKVGWLSAEYSMLPCATQKRTNRESSQTFKNARSVEISRLIGRCIRSIVDLSFLSEKTILIDCDVLQADGGTRVTALTAAGLALDLAEKRWLNLGIIDKNILKDRLAAISVGMIKDQYLLDLSYIEDSQADSDFNFVATVAGKIIEIQGTAEKNPLNWTDFENLKNLALEGIESIFEQSKNSSNNLKLDLPQKNSESLPKNNKPPMFCLGNRLNKTA